MTRLGRYRRTEILVGMFSLVGIAILVFGLLWLREFRFTRRYSVYSSVFSSTGGLLAGDPVMISGLRKGKVQSMHLLDDGVRVEIAIDQDVRLRHDAHAFIVTRGLLGERYIEVDRGKVGEPLPPGSVLPGDVQIGMAELMENTGELVDSAREVSEDVRKIVHALAAVVGDDKLEGGMHDATAVMHELRGTLEATRPDLEASVHDFRKAAESMARMTSSSETDVIETTAKLRSTAAQFDSLLVQLRTVAAKTDRVSDRLLEDDSTFGKMVSDRELYDRLLAVAAHADSLIADIKENPKKFLKISVF